VIALTQSKFPLPLICSNNAIRERAGIMPLNSSDLDNLKPDDRRMVKRLFVRVVAFYLVLAVVFVTGMKYLESPGASDQQHAAIPDHTRH
jgi:hypothetical protein